VSRAQAKAPSIAPSSFQRKWPDFVWTPAQHIMDRPGNRQSKQRWTGQVHTAKSSPVIYIRPMKVVLGGQAHLNNAMQRDSVQLKRCTSKRITTAMYYLEKNKIPCNLEQRNYMIASSIVPRCTIDRISYCASIIDTRMVQILHSSKLCLTLHQGTWLQPSVNPSSFTCTLHTQNYIANSNYLCLRV